jgi:hypothetical protein
MSAAIVFQFPLQNGFQEWDGPDAPGPMPELPEPHQRWTVRRKAAVIEAVHGGWIPSKRPVSFIVFQSMSFSAGSAISIAMASTVYAPRAIRFIAIPTNALPSQAIRQSEAKAGQGREPLCRSFSGSVATRRRNAGFATGLHLLPPRYAALTNA